CAAQSWLHRAGVRSLSECDGVSRFAAQTPAREFPLVGPAVLANATICVGTAFGASAGGFGGDAGRSDPLLSPAAGKDHGGATGSGSGMFRDRGAEAAAAVFSGGIDSAPAQESGPAHARIRPVSRAASGIPAGHRRDAGLS